MDTQYGVSFKAQGSKERKRCKTGETELWLQNFS